MESEDPEARIRELERRLADQAKASEVLSPGQRHHPPPPPNSSPPPPMPPQPGFGAPYPMPTRRPTRVRWPLVLALMIVAGTALAIGASAVNGVFTAARPLFGSTDTVPTASVDPAPSIVIGFPDIPMVPDPANPTAGPETVPPGGQLTVAGVRGTRTVACNEGSLSVSGVENTVIVSGHCIALTVSGVNNNVTVESAETINASGFDNRVTFGSGTPTVSKSGSGNVIEAG